MAIIDLHGMDTYSSFADMQASSAQSISGSGTATISAGEGKLLGNALLLNGSITYPAATTRGFAFWCKIPTLATFYLIFSSVTSGIAGNHIAVQVTSDGAVVLYRDRGNGSTQAFPAGTIVAGEYFFFSMSGIQGAGTAGQINVRVNNAYYEWQGVDTVYVGTANWKIQSPAGGIYIDDLVVTSDAVYYLNPPRVVETILPNSDRATQDFVPLNGGAGYVEINEGVPDGDTTYISATTPGDASEFNLGDLVNNLGDIACVKLSSSASREGSGGTNGVKTSLHTSGGTEVGSTTQSLTDGVYTIGTSALITTNPDTATSFQVSEVNGLYVRNEVV